jgi:uncharacterized protein YlxP (DUF503 family)
MFIAVAKLTLSIPDSGSLKSKRHVLHKVLDKVRARFNVSIAEVEDNDLWQKATLGIAAVANEHAFAQEMVSKVLKFIEDLYVAPVIACSTEVIPMGGDLYGGDEGDLMRGSVGRGARTLAEAELEGAAGMEGSEEEPGRRGRQPSRSEAPAPRERGGARNGSKGQRPMSPSERERAVEELRQRLRAARRAAVEDGEDES